MDIYINADVDKIKSLLSTIGFTIKRKKNHFSAMQYVKSGRYHVLFEYIGGETFCDFHYDNKIHGIGMGADYGKKPKEYFQRNLKEMLEQEGITYTVKQVNWFTRRNKAIVTGFRL